MRKYSKPLTSKVDFINEMIKDAKKHTIGFDEGLISNTHFTFDDITGFLLMKGLSSEFKEYLEEITEAGPFVDYNSIFIREIGLETEEEYLPFAELVKK